MSERARWLQGDVLAVAVIALAIIAGVLSQNWRRPPGMESSQHAARRRQLESNVDPSRVPKIDEPQGPRHRSPYNDSLTARAESICVTRVEANLESQYNEPFSAKVNARYGVGDQETGAGDSLDLDGIALAPSGRVSSWHCGMANYGSFVGSPNITRVESL